MNEELFDNHSHFTGTQKERMMMIGSALSGSAVSVDCARALCRAVLQ